MKKVNRVVLDSRMAQMLHEEEFIRGLYIILCNEEVTEELIPDDNIRDLLDRITVPTITQLVKLPAPPEGLKGAELERFTKVANGEVPVNGINQSYTKYIWGNILTLDHRYLNNLTANIITDLQEDKGGTRHQRFMRYMLSCLLTAAKAFPKEESCALRGPKPYGFEP